ncbi:hypothetical protein KP509_35G049400 [Ceratopteris richardii]|uniref:Cyclin-like domain-containing protein n=1 Tax=Ceratopteris richardii TaxID=49495 RepID=A0A8T2QFF2_CERRI|nr:hypothetical protein KP509_35G049400 [Ceratopteris richardii]
MVWCTYCAKDQIAEADDINGFTCCTGCGRVLDDNVYSSDPTFTKGADGQSSVQGNFIRDRQYSTYGVEGGRQYATDSHERTLAKGRDEITDIADFLAMGSREDAVNAAHRLYIIAVERNFTRGRRTNQVAAACLYIICRQEQKPFLLIDFSDCLQTNVYVLGAVFLQLCRLLSLDQHPVIQKPVDPSLFIHRFTDRLLRRSSIEGKRNIIAQTALRLVASMKRDWMQTGRRPSGICGAALFISAHIHGFDCTKADVVSVVHICEGTLTRRLVEFENTESGSLTPEEFEARAEELQSLTQEPRKVLGAGADREVLCEHKALGVAHYAVGLCKTCYDEFIRVSGGMEGGAAPPAFQASQRKEAERKKLQEKMLLEQQNFEENQVDNISVKKTAAKGGHSAGQKQTRRMTNKEDTNDTEMNEKHNAPKCEIKDNSQKREAESDTAKDKDHIFSENFADHFMECAELDTPEKEDTLSDIDDDEVDGYLHNQEEIRLKTIIWTEMNKEWKRKRDEAKLRGPAESATEATRQMLENKKLSSKVNYSALEKLFEGEVKVEPSKKKDEDKTDKKPGTDQHVQWADTVVNESKQDLTAAEKHSEHVLEKEEVEDEEDDDDEGGGFDDTYNTGDDQNYGLPYVDDYGDDGYEEY